MINIELLRSDPDQFRTVLKKRQRDPALIDHFLNLDTEWREVLSQSESMRAQQKKLGEERKIEEAKQLKEQLTELQKKLGEIETRRTELLLQIPNLLDADVPEGKDDSENKVIRTWGKPPKFSFEPLDHVALGEKLGIIDNERAAKVAEARFTYIKGGAALLQLALIQFVFTTLSDKKIVAKLAKKVGVSPKPFTPVFPPMMINPEIYTRMARLSPETAEERYKLAHDNLYLIGSAEHTLGSMYADEILAEEQLPIRYIGYSSSFRREAGAAGKDTRGILRLHQFDKLEMESFTAPEESAKEHEFFVAIQEYLLQQLEIPHEVMAVCSGDMGTPDFKQTDINAWMPGQQKYRETHTADYMTDYQTRRLGTKLRRADGSSVFVHTNDATAFAIGRTLIAIIENYQTEKGTVKVPKVLQKYAGIKEITA